MAAGRATTATASGSSTADGLGFLSAGDCTLKLWDLEVEQARASGHSLGGAMARGTIDLRHNEAISDAQRAIADAVLHASPVKLRL